MQIVVCMKWVPRRVVVDPVTASLEVDARTFGPSVADLSALEVALRLASHADDTITVLTAGPTESDAMLRDALASGADRAIRCPSSAEVPSSAVATVFARMLDDAGIEADLVVCGDHSTDRGSGSMPAFLAAELDVAQVLGVVALETTSDATRDPDLEITSLVAERRLDRGRRARLLVEFPAVVSVEGGVVFDGAPVAPRRASLPAMLAAKEAVIEPGPAITGRSPLLSSAPRPHRPRTKLRPVPSDGPAHQRILDITQATEDRTPPKTLHLAPDAAADAAIEALRSWGYLAEDPPPAS